jgi:hypothetical protein
MNKNLRIVTYDDVSCVFFFCNRDPKRQSEDTAIFAGGKIE